MRLALGACILAFGLALPPPQATGQSWCRASRANEPLLLDVERLLTSEDPESARQRETYNLSRSSPVTVVRDQAPCRRASQAYWDVLRTSVTELFGKHPDTPVLTVKVGPMYLVDDQRPRKGPDAYWEVMIFDHRWHRVSGYGAGADD